MLQVMIVDDDPSLRESLALALDGEFDVRVAASAEEAMASLDLCDVGVLVLDQHMGGLSGTAMLEALHDQPQIGVVMLSAAADVGLARRAMHLGAQDLLCKPCDLVELRSSIRATAACLRRAPGQDVPFALRGSRVLVDELERPGVRELEQRCSHFTHRLLAEALSEASGEHGAAAQRLGISLEEFRRLYVALAQN